MEYTEKDLVEFIVEASLHTYADPTAKALTTSYRPECDEYLYESGNWKYLDSYVWKRDGGGEEIVYYKNKPVWVMNYYGFIVGEATDTKAVYAFLHRALAKRHETLPVRGASYSEDVGFRYEVEYDREEIANLHGIERIYEHNTLVYECYLHGGFVQ